MHKFNRYIGTTLPLVVALTACASASWNSKEIAEAEKQIEKDGFTGNMHLDQHDKNVALGTLMVGACTFPNSTAAVSYDNRGVSDTGPYTVVALSGGDGKYYQIGGLVTVVDVKDLAYRLPGLRC